MDQLKALDQQRALDQPGGLGSTRRTCIKWTHMYNKDFSVFIINYMSYRDNFSSLHYCNEHHDKILINGTIVCSENARL